MKKHTKQILAFLLAIASVVTFMMPTVFASSATGTAPETAEPVVPAEPVIYHFCPEVAANQKIVEIGASLKAQYDAGQLNWRYEAASHGYQLRNEGSTRFLANSLQLYGGKNWWYALRLQSPGAGTYDLTLANLASTTGAEASQVYLVKASVIDQALGENAASYAQAIAEDPYQEDGTTEAFKAYKTAVEAAISTAEPVMTPDFKNNTAATGTFTFEADTEYVMVVKLTPASGAVRAQLTSLTATLQEETPEKPPVEDLREPKHYQFYTSDRKGKLLSTVTAQIKAEYEAGTSDWRYEAAASGYQFRLKDVHEGVTANGGNAYHNDNTQSIVYYGGGSQWFALRIQSPGAGKYALTLTHGTTNKGGDNSKVYIVKASEIDTVLGENAASYAVAMSADPYQNNGETEIFKAYKDAVEKAFADETPVMTPNFKSTDAQKDVTATGIYTFEANEEYVVIIQSNGYSYLDCLDAIPVVEEEPPVAEGEPKHYQIYIPEFKDKKLATVTAQIKEGYENGTYDWRYEAAASAYQFRIDGVSGAVGSGGNCFHNSYTDSLLYYGGGSQWFAIRIQSPGAGKYDLTLTYGASNKGGKNTKIFFIKASEIDAVLGENAASYAEAMSADPYQENGTTEVFTAYFDAINDAIANKTAVLTPSFYNADYQKGLTATGRFTFAADAEYIMVVQTNGHSYLNALDAVPATGDEPEQPEQPEVPVEPEGPTVTEGVYQFNIPEYAGDYLYHYRTEEELGKEIRNEEIAGLYAEGKLNWAYELSNGYCQFTNAYLSATIGEGNYLVFKIKAPGTGTYELTYQHYAINHEKSATYGDVHVIPVTEGKDYVFIKGEAAVRTPVITTNYYAKESGMVTAKGSYPAFEEGKEYWICLGVADNDLSKNNSIRLYPISISMERTGEWAPEPGNEPDDGIVYQLFREEYVQKYLHHSTEASVYDAVANRYASGSLNWRFESVAGNAYFQAKYLQLGTNKNGNAAIFRIKAPGTGTYKVTLKHFLNSDGKAANSGSLYILPYEEGLNHSEQIDRLARAPIFENTYSHTKPGTPPAKASGTYGFEEGKEYLVYIYGLDSMDPNNTSPSSTYMYVDRLVMKRIGDYVPGEEKITLGGVAIESPVSVFRTSDNIIISEVNGHDYMGIPAYGGTLMIYDLDEWRLLDEAYTGLETPRGAVVDHNGNYWLSGAGLQLYCYNPYTMEGFQTPKFLVGGSTHAMACGEDGYLYFGCYASTGATIFRVDPNNTTAEKASYQSWATPKWGIYVGDIHQEGDYIYAAVSGDDRHELLVYNKYTGALVSSHDFTKAMGDTRYLTGLDFLEPGMLAVCAPYELLVFNTETHEFIDTTDFGIQSPVYRAVSELRNGKSYFISNQDGLCEYDAETNKATPVGGELAINKTRLRSKDTNFVTIDDTRLPNPCLVTYGGMAADGLNLYCYNIEEQKVVTLIGLVDKSYAYGQNLHSLHNGLPGTGEIYFGAAYEAPVGVYNVNTQEFSRQIQTNGQSDSFLTYQDTIYIGEYNLCTLTQLKDGQAISLFRLNDEHKIFDQARIHTMSAGDNKVFVGTVPHVYRNGGLIAWYDLETELTYVVTGPEKKDVYYTKASQIMPTYTWYSAVDGTEVDFAKEFDQDVNGDGICEYFLGPIPLQTINNVVYRDGLLYGTSVPRGGSGAVDPAGLSAKLFIYDVEKMEMVKTYDLRNEFSGMPSKLLYISALAADPDISNKYWGIFSETLFSFTYDKETGKIDFKIELSFDRVTMWDGGRTTRPRDIIFKDGYMYFCFDKKGGFVKVNKNDPSDYVQLLSDFKNIYEIPFDYVLGEDGDLYYITGDTNLYVLNLDATEEELAQAKAVQDAIDLISETVTLADRAAIEAARNAWDALDPANQPYVNNYDQLVDAEVELLKCRVDALGEDITLAQEQELRDIGNDYRALTLKQRMNINYLAISKAESKMSILVAGRLVDEINAIGTVTLEKQDQIRAARASFMSLTRYERTLISNIELLNKAESDLITLQLQRNEADAVMEKIDAIGTVFFNFDTVKAAREAYDQLDDATKNLVTNYDKLKSAEILLIVECVVAAVIVIGSAVIIMVALRKKKVKAE